MQTSFHEGRTIGLLLTFIGGAMDSYTYIQYGAFASAQTGNIILSIIQAFDGEWLSVGKKVMSTLFFFLGILLTKYLIDYFRKKEKHFWRLFVLYYEAVIFFFVSLTPVHEHPALVTILIAFTASIQWVAFDKINGRAFIAGAIVLVFCHHLFGAYSILVVSILFLIMALTQTFQLWQFYHTNRFTF